MGPKVSGVTYKSRAKWKMLRGIYSAIYGEVNVSVSVCIEIKGDYIEKQQSCFISGTLKSLSGRKLLDSIQILITSWFNRLGGREGNIVLLNSEVSRHDTTMFP